MKTPADRRRGEEALDWVRRIHDPSFGDWDAHILWLEADPRNADAFDTASLLIDESTKNLAPPTHDIAPIAAVNDYALDVAHRRRLRVPLSVGLGGALAAGLAIVVALPSLIGGGAQPYRVQTTPGTMRSIALADGTSITLNGDSAVSLDHADPRTATVERGEAFFMVTHDAAHPFAVRAGNALFQDVGTSFDVVRDAEGTRVAVREGAVMYDPKGSAVRLDGGRQIVISKDDATVSAIDARSVGTWRRGRLSYRDATLGTVASDLTRAVGQSVAVDPRLRQRRFSGVIMVDPDRARMFHRIASVMDITIRRDGAGWQMIPRAQ